MKGTTAPEYPEDYWTLDRIGRGVWKLLNARQTLLHIILRTLFHQNATTG